MKKENNAPVPSQQNGITRRDALKTAAAVGATAALASTLPFSTASASMKGGHFKIAWSDASSGDSLDTTTYVSEFLALAGCLSGSPLVSLAPNMTLVPEVAESWETNDAQTWVFKLRKGVEFHNGKTLTSSDVIWSINRRRAEGAASGWRGVGSQIVEMTAGDNEVTFVLAAPNADWPYSLTDYHMKMQPEGEAPDKGIGTGAYVNENFDPGVRLSMTRNPNFYKSDAAYFDSLEVLGINDPAARVSALQTGLVHFTNAVPPKLANPLAAQFNIIRVPSTVFAEFVMHTTNPPFDDDDMRLALKYAIDREDLIDKVFQGAAVAANDHPIPAMFRYAPRDLPQRVYDPEKAMHHYKKAGSPAIPPPSTSNVAFNGSMEAAELFQTQARNAGIPFDIKRAPDDGYWANTWHQAPWFASTWYGRASEDQLLSQMLVTGSGYNESQWARAHIDQMLLDARAELDDSKRAELYGSILTELSNEGGHIIPAHLTTLYGSTNNIGGFRSPPVGGDCTFADYLHFTS